MHANDNRPPNYVPVIGYVGDGGRVTITDPEARRRLLSRKRPALRLVDVAKAFQLFPWR